MSRYLPYVAVLLICAGAASDIRAAAAVGKVVALEGTVTASAVDGKKRALQLASDIFVNDKIVTAEKSKVQIKFTDDTLFSQGERGEVVIDKYVYDPDGGKEGNSSLKLSEGVFRVITGKITQMNPDRFKVRTKMATIGIRGCELGFRVRGKREDVYVLDLPPGHSILVNKNVIDQGDGLPGDVLKIVKSGVAVTIQLGVDLKERKTSADETKQLVRDSTPAQAAGGGGGGVNEKDGAQLKVGNEAVQGILAARSQSQTKQSLTVKPSAPESAPAPETKQPSKSGEKWTPPNWVEPTEAPSLDSPETEPPAMVAGNPELNDWEWGIWADGTVQYKPNSYLGATFLTSDQFSQVLAATTPYNLSGSGEAGASVYHAASGESVVLYGSCNINVMVGGQVTPAWGGSFSLADSANNSLSFSVSPSTGGGLIGSDGSLSLGGLSSYSLSVKGDRFDQSSLTASSVNGNLVRPADGSREISAVGGEFGFAHGSAARVNGAFGADLR